MKTVEITKHTFADRVEFSAYYPDLDTTQVVSIPAYASAIGSQAEAQDTLTESVKLAAEATGHSIVWMN